MRKHEQNDSPQIRFEFKVDLKAVRHPDPKPERPKKEPQLRRCLLLVYKIEELISSNKAKDYRQISRWLHMTPARVSQLTNLLLLSPKIQEAILFSQDPNIQSLTEYRIRKIPMEICWKKQEKIWDNIIRRNYTMRNKEVDFP